jgi:GntR family transcriptional regulator
MNFIARRRAETLDSTSPTCHITAVTLLRLDSLRPGQTIFDQVVFAAKKAFISGEFAPGQAFPSVRALAADLKIHPNTAHKVVQHLIHERYLEARPGIGTVVAELPRARAGDRKRLVNEDIERLVVEARRVGLELYEVIDAIEAQWAKLEKPAEVIRK